MASILGASSLVGASSEYSTSEASSSRALPPHLRGSVGKLSMSLTPSTDQLENATASTWSSFVRQLPPHLRPLVQQALSPDASSDFAIGSDFGDGDDDKDSGSVFGSISTATTAREVKTKAKPRRVSFNAWDPKGRPHRGIKAATESSATASSAAAVSDAGGEEQNSPNPASQVRGGWWRSKDVGYVSLSTCPSCELSSG